MSYHRKGLSSHARTARDGGVVVLGWQPHPWWPVLHNLRRARAVQDEGKAVLLVRTAALRRWRHALFPTDFSPGSLALLRRAIALLPSVRFTLLHAYRVSGDGILQAAGVGRRALDACFHRAERRARAAGARFARQVEPCDARLLLLARRQSWAGAVADCADSCGADLLVVSDVAGPAWRCWWPGAGLGTLLSRTGCDLLLLPAVQDRRDHRHAEMAKCAASSRQFTP